MKTHVILAAAFFAGSAVLVPAYAADGDAPQALEEEAAAPPAAPESQAPAESADAYKQRVFQEMNRMEKNINQLKKPGDLTAEQKGALTTYKERRKVVLDRIGTVDSADSAQTGTAITSVDASLKLLQESYGRVVELFQARQ